MQSIHLEIFAHHLVALQILAEALASAEIDSIKGKTAEEISSAALLHATLRWEAMTPEEMAKMIADIWAALDSYAFGADSGDVGGDDDTPTVPDLGEDVFIDRATPASWLSTLDRAAEAAALALSQQTA
jgi:hypothetical protein